MSDVNNASTVPVIPEKSPPPASLSVYFNVDPGSQEVTTFDLTKDEDSLGYLMSMGGAAVPCKQLVNTTIEVCHFTARVATLTAAETGEVIECVRMVMVGPDGQLYSTTSPAVIRMLASVAKTAFGKPPWNPPMAFKLTTQKTGGGGDCILATPIPPKTLSTAKPPKK